MKLSTYNEIIECMQLQNPRECVKVAAELFPELVGYQYIKFTGQNGVLLKCIAIVVYDKVCNVRK